MEEKDFTNLGIGDIVRHRSSGDSYVIIEDYPNLIGIRTIKVSNISEGTLAGKNSLNQDKLIYPPELNKCV